MWWYDLSIRTKCAFLWVALQIWYCLPSGRKFNCCNLVWNSYLSNVSAELSANVSVLRYLLLFRDNQDIYYHPFETDEIAIAIICICTRWFADVVCVFMHFMLFICAQSPAFQCVESAMFNCYFSVVSCYFLFYMYRVYDFIIKK